MVRGFAIQFKLSYAKVLLVSSDPLVYGLSAASPECPLPVPDGPAYLPNMGPCDLSPVGVSENRRGGIASHPKLEDIVHAPGAVCQPYSPPH